MNFAIQILFAITLTTHQLSLTNAQCDPTWEPFNKEKCIKIIKDDKTRNYNEAIRACQNQRNATLLTILTAEEQQFLTKFIFGVNKIVDNVWIGLRRNRITGDFRWPDQSPVEFESWANNYPIEGFNCVQMVPFDGRWTNWDCARKNAVVCQKQQELSLNELQTMVWKVKRKLKDYERELAETNHKLIENTKDLRLKLWTTESKLITTTSQLNQLKDQQFKSHLPIGFIYVQLPNQSKPEHLFPNTIWSDVSDEYAGLFFRAAGKTSEEFGEIQEESSPGIVGAKNTFWDKSDADNVTLFETEGKVKWSKPLFTGGVTGSPRYTSFKLSVGEVRPRNTAVKIWKRVK